eukprot:CAMPEP_0116006440 /NCGR_PEP_ID=MMETSP0321-20121206/1730_1 /TAXON_ID=163516 /ORGANISM="Leptocylindrus danicus var. danicus, Strain B650" /LENGTH=2265 /DNA_ID=CAMNT_0003474995 /DNA_START=74 /DNA_END=6868 /DNA_ORIENTATION=-
MGQTIGRVSINSEAQPFVNLPHKTVQELWEAFNDVAEGFGLNIDEFQDMIRLSVKDFTGISDKRLNALSEVLFRVYDDDCNSMVDSFEFLSSIAILSSMSNVEKLRYLYRIYDFDESGMISINELTLMFHACMAGLSKICDISNAPIEPDLDRFATIFFDANFSQVTEDADKGTVMITRDSFISFALDSAEINSWFAYFGDLDDISSGKHEPFETEKLALSIHSEGRKRHEDHVFSGGILYSLENDSGPSADCCIRGNADDHMAAPAVKLSLDWTHGFNSRGAKQNALFVGSEGAVIYPVGTMCVKSSRGNRKESCSARSQLFFCDHTAYVSCLALFETDVSEHIMATGERAEFPTIRVWSINEMETLVLLRGFHKVGVSHVDFSPSGKHLVSVGMDKYHSIAVYEWGKQSLIFSSCSTRQSIHDCRFLLSDELFVTCGNLHTHFWAQSTGSLKYCRARGILGDRMSRNCSINCLASLSNQVIVSGTSTGHICEWEGRNCFQVHKAHHSGSVEVNKKFARCKDEFCLGTNEGIVQIWSNSFQLLNSFSIDVAGGLGQVICSLQWDLDRKKFLVGLQSNEIFELDDADGVCTEVITQSHFGKQLFGLDVNPVKPTQFVTAGGDKTVRLWDSLNHTVSRMVQLDSMIRCVAFSPDGKTIAIGLGGTGTKGKKDRKDGAFTILREHDFCIIHEARDSRKALTTCKFSKDSTTLAFGSLDQRIYIYDTKRFSLVGRTKHHQGAITSIDFGRADASDFVTTIRSTSSETDEILFWDLAGTQQSRSSQAEMQWDSSSCTISETHKKCAYSDGAIILCYCRSASGDYAVTADDHERIRVFRYPVDFSSPLCWTIKGHSSNISNVRFLADDSCLISTEADECCVFQWKIEHLHQLNSQTTQMIADSHIEGYVEAEAEDNGQAWDDAMMESTDALFKMEVLARDEHFVPRRPWQQQIVAPSSRNFRENTDEPDHDLTLEWVHGYNSSFRNNVLYSSNSNEVLYHVANVVVKRDLNEKNQSYFMGAKDEITCISVHPSKDKSICAVGQKGRHPFVHIFDYTVMEMVQVLHGHHQRAISNIRFDRSGKYLCTIGQDLFHTLIIYDWSNGTIKHESQTVKMQTLCIDFCPVGKRLVQCGKGFIRFWELGNSSNLTFSVADLDVKGKLQPFYGIGWIGNSPIIGTDDGFLYMFEGRRLERKVKAHTSAIYTIHYTNEGIVTGSKEGTVKIWGQQLECKRTIDMRQHTLGGGEIRSVCWDIDRGKIVVGSSSNEIWEMDLNNDFVEDDCSPLTKGNTGCDSWVLAAHPFEARFITVGSDRYLRVWCAFQHILLKSIELEMKSYACTYSPDGQFVAVGFTSTYNQKNSASCSLFDGKWVILDEDDEFAVVFEARDASKAVTEIKWSPNGQIIAIGSRDTNIYLYKKDNGVVPRFSIVSIFEQHNSQITSLDFSADSKCIRSNCDAKELYFFSTEEATCDIAPSRIRDLAWETQTCTLSWAVHGVWPRQNDGTDIAALDCNLKSNDGSYIIAVGDNFGRLKLFNFPCLSPCSLSKSYHGHSGLVSGVKWIGTGSHLVSCGRKDQAIMVWKHSVDDVAVVNNEYDVSSDEAKNEERVGAICVLDNEVTKHVRSQTAHLGATLSTDETSKSMARPWVTSIVEPSITKRQSEPNLENPKVKLELMHVHGFQSQCIKNALAYNQKGDLVFSAASLCVIQNRFYRGQMHYRQHKHQISCLTVSPTGRLAATGDFSLRPQIQIWDANTAVNIASLRKHHRRGVLNVDFSLDSKLLVSLGADDGHSLAVWYSATGEWHDWILRSQSNCGPETVFFTKFTVPRTDFAIVSGGISHLKFWTSHGPHLSPAKAVFNGKSKMTSMICGALLGYRFVTGSEEGSLFAWSGRSLEEVVAAHSKCISAMYSTRDQLVTGSDDGTVKLWSPDLEVISLYNLHEKLGLNISISCLFAASSICSRVTKILVGSLDSDIYEISASTGDVFLLHEGHGGCGEVWGLAMHPLESDLFATCGDDSSARVWSIKSRKLLQKRIMDRPLRSIIWSNDGKELIVGCGSPHKKESYHGSFIILEADTLKTKFEGRGSNYWVTDMKCSPNGETIAMATSENEIIIIENDIKRNYRVLTAIDKHNARINSIDFSVDSYVIQSSSNDYEHLYHGAEDGEQINLTSQLKMIEWKTYTCTYGWPVQGIWPKKANIGKDPEPTSAHRSTSETLLITGYTNGDIKLYNYPVLSKDSKFCSESGHIGHISKCRFSCDEKSLVTVGRRDRTMLVW